MLVKPGNNLLYNCEPQPIGRSNLIAKPKAAIVGLSNLA
jgi:hypothetical protein